MIPLQKDQAAIWNKDSALASDHDDDGLTGDVQVADALAVPGILTAQDKLFQVDVLVVPQRLRPQHQSIAGEQLHAAPGHYNPIIPLNGGHNDAGGQAQILNGLS